MRLGKIRIQNVFNFILFFTLVACGATRASSPKIITGLAPKDIRETWRLVYKSCDGVEKAGSPDESYRLDGDHFVRVVKSRDDETTLCRHGYIYEKALTKFGNLPSGGYFEQGTLTSRTMKKSCWRKRDGVIGGPSVDDVVSFGPESLTIRLAAISAGALTVDLRGTQECSGVLTLGLIRK